MAWIAQKVKGSGPISPAESATALIEGAQISSSEEENSGLQSARLELALWQEGYLERRSSQYDSAIGNILVVAGLVSAASAAVLALQPDLSSSAWWLIVASGSSVLASIILLAPSLVKSKNDENGTGWSSSVTVADPVKRHIIVVDARAGALAGYMRYRMGLVYTGFALAILGGGSLILYLIIDVALPLIFH
ncbi:hypothetical protein [Cryobacterium sp. PH31-L1]|uniref:hypothetical protein n=1 Tax=Cryobacterium sp. PH31-L1 TaxID=3046199 RepID=UPI0024B89657|nr:hypothetical protein [Cryobacterium sp. PH31-L1]MDJ0378506.1 hypothetical protein [Cryobacterium sp. PH31-L1]